MGVGFTRWWSFRHEKVSPIMKALRNDFARLQNIQNWISRAGKHAGTLLCVSIEKGAEYAAIEVDLRTAIESKPFSPAVPAALAVAQDPA